MFARLLAEAVPRTEDASGAAGGGFHAPGAPENASRTTGGCSQSVESAVPRASETHSVQQVLFCEPLEMRSMWQVLFCEPLKTRRVPEKAVFDTEYLSRTVGACFLHRMLLKMRRVP